MTKRAPIPYRLTRGEHQPIIAIEAWFDRPIECVPGAGYLRTFDANDWAHAAAYATELNAGKLSGRV